MSAISPERLKIDVAELAQHFSDRRAFAKELDALFSRYSDRTVRPAQAGKPSTLQPVLHVPSPVLRMITIQLSASIQNAPEHSLRLIDSLWENKGLEYKQLAVRFLSALAPGRQEDIEARVIRWSGDGLDEDVLAELFRLGEKIGGTRFLEQVEEWLESGQPFYQDHGLIAAEALVARKNTPHLPRIFKMLAPFLNPISPEWAPRLSAIFGKLVACSPEETAFFFREMYINSSRPELGRMIRQHLRAFPPKMRGILSDSLQSTNQGNPQ